MDAVVRGLIYLAQIGVVVAARPVRDLWRRQAPWRRALLVGLFVLLAAGQINARKYSTYPFVKWGMYDGGGRQFSYYEYTGIRADGSRAPFPVAHLVRTHSSARALECPTCGKRLLWRLRDLANDAIEPEPGQDPAALRDLHERTLRAAWGVYHARHPEETFERVEIWRAHVRVKKYRDLSSIRREKLWVVELDGPAAG